jgi:hypothetical protein
LSDSNNPKRGAGVAGAGGGTAYLGLLSYIPDQYHQVKDGLAFLAPVLTVIFGILWLLASNWVSRKVLDWELRGALTQTCAIRDGILADPHAAVANLKKLQMEAIHDGVAEVRARLKSMRN